MRRGDATADFRELVFLCVFFKGSVSSIIIIFKLFIGNNNNSQEVEKKCTGNSFT